MLFGRRKKYVVHTVGDPVLRETAAPVAVVTPEIRALTEEMIGAMRAFQGIGLAAPQAGKSLRLVVFDVPLDSMSETPTVGEQLLLPRMPFVAVNPEIVATSDSTVEHDEGCLSLPVARPGHSSAGTSRTESGWQTSVSMSSSHHCPCSNIKSHRLSSPFLSGFREFSAVRCPRHQRV